MSALVTILSRMEKGRNSSFEPQKMKLGSKNLFKKLNINFNFNSDFCVLNIFPVIIKISDFERIHTEKYWCS